MTSHRVPLGTVLSIAWCSARLAIVLRALNVLVRGFQEADRAAHPAVLAEALRHNPSHIYGGMLTTLMRMVFVLYTEDRSRMGSTKPGFMRTPASIQTSSTAATAHGRKSSP
ncbi:MAG: hypothetical protein ABSF64_00635 [Bryobacteraceae bacterium]